MIPVLPRQGAVQRVGVRKVITCDTCESRLDEMRRRSLVHPKRGWFSSDSPLPNRDKHSHLH